MDGDQSARRCSMSAAAFGRVGLVTEEEYLSLGETPERVELFDGRIEVSPSPTPAHQRISRRIANALDGPALDRGFEVFEAINVRLLRERIAIPDLVVLDSLGYDQLVADAQRVQLVCEIISPTNAANDRVLKMRYYAEAGIPFYLLANPEPGLTLQLFRLTAGRYVLEHEAGSGLTLRLIDPVEVELDPDELQRRPTRPAR
jgi:Uma2 family endonuclease